MDTPDSLTCSRCKKDLPVSDFYKSSRSSTGFMSVCKSCRAEIDRASRLKRKCLTPPDLSSTNPKFADMQSRSLIAQLREIVTELKARGYAYKGELTYLQRIKI